MALPDTSGYPAAKQSLLSSRPLTGAEVTALKTELSTDPAGRGFKAGGVYQPPAALFPLLNDPYGAVNPAAMVPVNVGHLDLVSWGQFASRMLGRLRNSQAAAMQASPPQTPSPMLQLLIDTINEQDKLATKTGFVDMTGSAWQGFRPLAIALGATTDAELKAIETKPDPAYQPTLLEPSRAQQAVGYPLVVELADIPQLTV